VGQVPDPPAFSRRSGCGHSCSVLQHLDFVARRDDFSWWDRRFRLSSSGYQPGVNPSGAAVPPKTMAPTLLMLLVKTRDMESPKVLCASKAEATISDG
jgi:hypothetical protein